VPHLPIYYRFSHEFRPLHFILSTPILVITHTPDFSMPFNVNAVTHIVFGSLFINTFAVLFFNYKEEEEKEEEKKE
jgi:hypothetical protein